MKRIFRVFSALLLCLCLVVCSVLTAVADTPDTTIRVPKKVISIAFDDSGSMRGDRWVYATYALQALVAQLNSQDELYITRMSFVDRGNGGMYDRSDKIDLSGVSSVDAQLKDIRSWKYGNSTPLRTVDTAMKTLKSIQSTEPDTQYWLLILTDGKLQPNTGNDAGEFTADGQMYSYLKHDKDLSDSSDKGFKYSPILGEKMANDSLVNVAYIGLGSGAIDMSSHSGDEFHPFFAKDNGTIVKTMGDVSALISGRLKISDIKQVDDTTISFTSPLPMYSFSILSQQSNAKVVSAASSENQLNIDRNLGLSAKDNGSFQGDAAMSSMTINGNVAVINNAASGSLSTMEKGTYTVKFDGKVDAKNMLIQYEPAIGISLKITKNGIDVEDPSTLYDGDKIDITIVPVVASTNDVISDSDLPNGISWGIEYELEGDLVDSSGSKTLTGVTVHQGENTIRGIMTLPGYAPSENSIYFTVKALDLGIETENDGDLQIPRSELGTIDDDKAPHFYITNSDKRMTKEEINNIGVKLRVENISCEKKQYDGFLGFLTNFSNSDPKINFKQNQDGSYTLVPDSPFWFTSFLVKPGDYTVEVVTDPEGGKATVHFALEASLGDWLNLFILLIIFLFLLYLIYIFFIKYKFPSGTIQADMYRLDRSTGKGKQSSGQAPDPVTIGPLKGHLFAPTRACSFTYNGLRIVAGPYGSVIISGKSVANAVAGYNKPGDGISPLRNLGSIKKQMTLTANSDGKPKEISDLSLDNTPIYFIDDMGDVEIWCIWLE